MFTVDVTIELANGCVLVRPWGKAVFLQSLQLKVFYPHDFGKSHDQGPRYLWTVLEESDMTFLHFSMKYLSVVSWHLIRVPFFCAV